MSEKLHYQHLLHRGTERLTTWLDGAVPVGKRVTLKDDDGGPWTVYTRGMRGFPKSEISAHRKTRLASIQG